MDRSNVSVVSNVYEVRTEKVVEDRDFRKQIRGKGALRKLYRFLYGPAPDYVIEKELRKMGLLDCQIEIYWHQDIPCSYAAGEKPWGLVLAGDTKVVCRCRRRSCPEFRKCHL